MNREADELDSQIIELLRADPTIQNSQISDETGVSNATIGTRIKKLRDSGMLRVVASTDVRAAGFNVVAMVTLELASGRSDACARVATELARYPQIIGIGSLLHQEQIIFNLLGRDPSDIEQSLTKISTAVKGIAALNLRFYLSFLKNSLNTGPIHDLQPNSKKRLEELKNTRLGETYNDRELLVLAVLQGDGRISLRQAAQQLDLPESQVRAAVRKFENTPGVLSYQTMIDPRLHGNQFACLVLMRVNYNLVPQAIKVLKPLPETTQLSTLTGSRNLAAIFIVRDRRRLQTIVDEQIRRKAKIAELEIIDLVGSYKYDGAWNLPIAE